LDVNREDIAFGEDYQDLTRKVIRAANSEGWAHALIAKALLARPKNAALRELAEETGLVLSTAGLESVIAAGLGFF
jgi:hypothetical protein